MKIRLLASCALLCALPAHGDGVTLPSDVRDALTQVDALPTTPDLAAAIPASPPPTDYLLSLAGDSTVDFSVRIRALGALPTYCSASPSICWPSTPVNSQLRAFITALVAQPELAPRDAVWLRASIEILGATTSPSSASDVAALISQIDHPSRDIRAAAAHALHRLCKPASACCTADVLATLKAHYASEAVPQVKLAIYTALQDVVQCVN